jgi:hypothetical protein
LNEYYKDVPLFFKKAVSVALKNKEKNASAFEGILFFALGMERLLKGILYDINPIYILKNQDFKHSAPSIYKSRFISGTGKNNEVSASPDSDVLTFKLSLARAKLFSESAAKHSNFLYSLSNLRDIIVHRPLNELATDSFHKILRKELFAVIKDFSSEIPLSLEELLGKRCQELQVLHEKLQESELFEKEIKNKFSRHKEFWESHRKDKNHIETANISTARLKSDPSREYMYEVIKCPVCDNESLVKIEPDYDVADGQGYISGVFVESLKCYYCGLELSDYEELDHFDINSILEQKK